MHNTCSTAVCWSIRAHRQSVLTWEEAEEQTEVDFHPKFSSEENPSAAGELCLSRLSFHFFSGQSRSWGYFHFLALSLTLGVLVCSFSITHNMMMTRVPVLPDRVSVMKMLWSITDCTVLLKSTTCTTSYEFLPLTVNNAGCCWV